MVKIRPLVLLCVLSGLAMAQTPTASRPEGMRRLDFLVGQWRGEGWIEFGPGQHRTFRQTEVVQLKVDGAILLIDGLGKGKVPGKEEELTVHNAFAVVSYDDKAKVFRWRAYRAGGGWIDTEAMVGENNLEWGFHDERAGDIRFTIRLNEKGRWFEVGEFSRDRSAWHKFFEMTLDQVK